VLGGTAIALTAPSRWRYEAGAERRDDFLGQYLIDGSSRFIIEAPPQRLR
jgi:hypothetical protein